MISIGLYSWDSCNVLAAVLTSEKAAAMHRFLTLGCVDAKDANHGCPGRSRKQEAMTMVDKAAYCCLQDREVGRIGC